jgi:hypothetical protein
VGEVHLLSGLADPPKSRWLAVLLKSRSSAVVQCENAQPLQKICFKTRTRIIWIYMVDISLVTTFLTL